MKVLLTLAVAVLGAVAARRVIRPSAADPWHEATTPDSAQASAPADAHPGT